MHYVWESSLLYSGPHTRPSVWGTMPTLGSTKQQGEDAHLACSLIH